MALNKVIIMGNISNEVELKQTQGGTSVCSFNVAVGRYSKDPREAKTDFFTVVAWQQKAEFVSRYFKKGNPILICGQLQTRSWNDNQGQKRYTTEVVAEEVSFVASAAQTAAQGMSAPTPAGNGYTPDAYGAPAFNSAPSANFEEIPNDGDLPF